MHASEPFLFQDDIGPSRADPSRLHALSGGQAVRVPIEFFDTHTAIIGQSGLGKTYTAKGGIEDLLLAERRVHIIDPMGVYWGLRAPAAQGQGQAFKIMLLGGKRGDMPIAPGSAGLIVDMLERTQASAIFDLSLLKPAGLRAWMTDYAETIYMRNEASLHLVVDEADMFMPQVVGRQQFDASEAWTQLLQRGRTRGFRVVMITQRPAKLNKTPLSMARGMITLGVLSPQDKKVVTEWMGSHLDAAERKRLTASLPGLPKGEGYIWMPGFGLDRMRFPLLRTFDSSNDAVVEAVKPNMEAVDIDAFRDAIAALLAPAATADDAESADDKRPIGERLLAARELGARQARAEIAAELAAARADVLRFEALLEDLRGRIAGATLWTPAVESGDAPAAPTPSTPAMAEIIRGELEAVYKAVVPEVAGVIRGELQAFYEAVRGGMVTLAEEGRSHADALLERARSEMRRRFADELDRRAAQAELGDVAHLPEPDVEPAPKPTDQADQAGPKKHARRKVLKGPTPMLRNDLPGYVATMGGKVLISRMIADTNWHPGRLKDTLLALVDEGRLRRVTATHVIGL